MSRVKVKPIEIRIPAANRNDALIVVHLDAVAMPNPAIATNRANVQSKRIASPLVDRNAKHRSPNELFRHAPPPENLPNIERPRLTKILDRRRSHLVLVQALLATTTLTTELSIALMTIETWTNSTPTLSRQRTRAMIVRAKKAPRNKNKRTDRVVAVVEVVVAENIAKRPTTTTQRQVWMLEQIARREMKMMPMSSPQTMVHRYAMQRSHHGPRRSACS
jgi:hypothetical protein